MKKLILLIQFILFCCIAFSQWSGYSSNQLISENDINYAMITTPWLQLKAPLPNGLTSKHCLTKAQLLASFYVDATNTTLAAKSSSQIISKQDITAFTFSSYYPHNLSNAQSSGSAACGTTLSNVAPVYTSVNTAPIVGTIFYTNTALTTTFGGSNLWWLVTYSNATYYVVQINGVGSVTATFACGTPPSKT